MVLGVANRVLYKMALQPLSDYVFFLAQFQTFAYVIVYFAVLGWKLYGYGPLLQLSNAMHAPIYSVEVDALQGKNGDMAGSSSDRQEEVSVHRCRRLTVPGSCCSPPFPLLCIINPAQIRAGSLHCGWLFSIVFCHHDLSPPKQMSHIMKLPLLRNSCLNKGDQTTRCSRAVLVVQCHSCFPTLHAMFRGRVAQHLGVSATHVASKRGFLQVLGFLGAARLPGVVLPLISQSILLWQIALARIFLGRRLQLIQANVLPHCIL